jgi:MATE family multidrug resistance protein
VGQAIGAGAKDEVPRIVGLTFRAAATWQGLVGIAYVAVPLVLLAPFTHDGSADFVVVGRRMLMLSAAWQLFDATANTIAEALRAAGDTVYPLWARLAIAWLVFTPIAFVGVKLLGWGDVGAMLAVVLYLALLAGVLFFRFRSGAWRRIQLIEEPTVAQAA